MHKIPFAILILCMIIMTLPSLGSHQYHQAVQYAHQAHVNDPHKIKMISLQVIWFLVVIGLITWYFTFFVPLNLIISFLLIELTSLVIGLTDAYSKQLTQKQFFRLDKLIAICELILLVTIGWAGLTA